MMTSNANGSRGVRGQDGCHTLRKGPDCLDRLGWASCNYLARTRTGTLGEMEIRWKSKVGTEGLSACCGMWLRWYALCILMARLFFLPGGTVC